MSTYRHVNCVCSMYSVNGFRFLRLAYYLCWPGGLSY